MSLLFTEGFDQYDAGATTTAGLDRRYSYGGNGASIVAGASPNLGNVGYVWNVRYLQHALLASRQPASTDKICFAFWFKLVDAPLTNQPILNINTDTFPITGTNPLPQLLNVGVTTSNALFVTAHGDSAIVDQTANDVIVTGEWHHIEFELLAANSGTAKIYVDEVLVLDSADDYLVSSFTTYTGFSFEAGASSYGFYFDDIVAYTDQGSDFNTFPIGQHEIETLIPDADSSVDFTPLSGDNYTNIDDAGKPDSDTTYNESTNVGDIDEFTIPNQSTTPLATLAIAVHTVSKKTLSGGVTLSQHVVAGESPATDHEGDSHSLVTGYEHYDDYWASNPSSTAPWGNTDINSLLVGYRNKA